jgi:hypothetical protein
LHPTARSHWFVHGALLWALTVVAVPAAGAAEVAPLGPSERAALGAIPDDPAPAALIQETHYFISNESFPERFRPAFDGVGGIFVGVGPEQNYLFASWAEPEILLLIDFDQMIVDLHRVYRELFLASADPQAFIARWAPAERDATRALLGAAIADEGERGRVLTAFDKARPAVYPRMQLIRMRYGNLGVRTFLSDPDSYRYLRAMHQEGRVRALRGDLTARATLRGVAEFARALRLPVRGIYLSNVEFYFDYASGLGENLASLPVDGRSRVARTVPFKHRGSDYRYVVQSALDMQEWLKRGEVANLRELLLREAGTLKDEVWYVPGPR